MASAARPNAQTPALRKHRLPSLSLPFPALLHFWPLLLVVSQKAVVPFGYLRLNYNNRAVQSDLATVIAMLMIAATTLAFQQDNPYSAVHYAGYSLFLLSIPPINYAIRRNRNDVLAWIAAISVFNCALAFIAFIFEIDLAGLRGLNRVINQTGVTDRVYFETSSLLAVFTIRYIRPPWLSQICAVIVLAYALLLGKSVFVGLLFLTEQLAPFLFLRPSLIRKVMAAGMIVIVAIIGPVVLALTRPDFDLSVAVKILQFQTILNSQVSLLWGGGWGYYISAIANDVEQPYQIEMQLPMLFAQIGVLQVLFYVLGVFLLFRSISTKRSALWLRMLTYLIIGLSNPWLLIPSWYLTVALMFSDFDRPRSLAEVEITQ